MMKTIYKYELELHTPIAQVEVPVGAQVLHFDAQDNRLYLWALVDPSAAATTRLRFHVVGTGHSLDESKGLVYRATILMYSGALVLHIFEIQ
jgi:hypothetical protein